MPTLASLLKTLPVAAALTALSTPAPAGDPPGHGAAPAKPATPSHAPTAPAVSKPAPAKPLAITTPKDTKPAAADPHAAANTRAAATRLAAHLPGATSPDEAVQLLREGNERWVSGATQDPNIDSERRAALAAQGQAPFVTVLSCADSRVPVERLFDRGVGEVFTVRVAGNTAWGAQVGTIEYGVEHLHTPLVVVMGHTKCGAVAASATHAEVHGAIADLLTPIAPAVDRAARNNPGLDGDALVAAAVRENVWQAIYDLYKASPVCRDMAAAGEIKIVGAVCDIATGKVEWMGAHPWEAELLAAIAAQQTIATASATASAEHPAADNEAAHSEPAAGHDDH